jgi:hypothetical protein
MKKILNVKCVIWFFSKTFIWSISASKNSVRYRHKYGNVFMSSIRYPCRILIKLELS